MSTRKPLEPSEDSREASDSQIGVVRAREIKVVKPAAKEALSASTDIAESCAPSSGMPFVDLHEKADDSSSAKTMLRRALAQNTDENTFKESDTHCVQAE